VAEQGARDSVSIDISFAHVPAQTAAYAKFKNGNRICNAWGRGTGKSWWLRTCIYLLIAEYDGTTRATPAGDLRGVRVNLLLPTFTDFKRLGHAQKLVEELARGGKWGCLRADINKSDWTVRFPGGSYLQVLTAETENRGARSDMVGIDEADEIPLAYYESVVGPWFTEPFSLNRQIVTGTPKKGRYGLLYHAYKVWTYGDAEHEPVPRCYSFHATVLEATGDIISRAEIERARLGNKARFETEYLCNFDAGEGLVYPHFRDEFHVRYPHPETEWREFVVGVDWGYEDPNIYLAFGIAGHGRDVQLHLLGEWVVRQKTPSELIELARHVDGLFPNARWYADPADPEKIEMLRRPVQLGPDGYNRGGAGVRISKANNSIDGLATVADVLLVRQRREPLGEWAQLFVHPDCKHTIHEFGLYRRKKESRSSDTFKDDLAPGNDHCLVAGTMVATARGDVPIELVVAGDFVLTRQWLKPVVRSWLARRNAETVTATFDNGHELRGTPEHLVWTENRGWSRLDSLGYADTLGICPSPHLPGPNESSSRGCRIADIPTPTGSPTVGTFGQADRADDGLAICTSMFGALITETCRSAMMYTTLTATRATTTSRISSVCRARSIAASTPAERSGAFTSCGYSLSQWCGTQAKPERGGTLSTVACRTPPGRREQRCALSAAPRSRTSAIMQDSALTCASPRIGASPASTPSSSDARCATARHNETDTAARKPARVVAVRSSAAADVYDLTVADAHEFYANGILVHNCMDALRYAIHTHFGGTDSRIVTGYGAR
jgi:hypothetical protein